MVEGIRFWCCRRRVRRRRANLAGNAAATVGATDGADARTTSPTSSGALPAVEGPEPKPGGGSGGGCWLLGALFDCQAAAARVKRLTNCCGRHYKQPR